MKIDYERIEYLVSNFEKTLPRYTSYPTAPMWSDTKENLSRELIQQSAEARRPLSLYVHIPFCESRCLFCGCNTVITQDINKADPYLNHLFREMDLVAKIREEGNQGGESTVSQVHFGGGTPTFLNPPRLKQLNNQLRSAFTFSENDKLEYSVEIDPAVTSKTHFDTLKEIGVNRISLGIQDFHDDILESVNRPQNYQHVLDLYQYGRELEFSGINFDIMYGLPGQTEKLMEENIAFILDLKPDRIALFSYAHVPWIKPHQKALEKYELLEGFPKFRLFLRALELLTENGYDYIGLDHFARSQDALAVAKREKKMHRNFQGYTTGKDADLLGFGLTAISGTKEGYWQNPKEMVDYYQKTARRELPTVRGHRNSEEDIRRKKIILEVLCHGSYRYANEAELMKDISNQKELLDLYLKEELITLDNQEINLTVEGQLFSRNVASLFDTYLLQQSGDKPVFSKTV